MADYDISSEDKSDESLHKEALEAKAKELRDRDDELFAPSKDLSHHMYQDGRWWDVELSSKNIIQ